MSETLALTIALAIGILLGTMFYGGLWWTICRGVSSSRPTLWFLGSLILRTSVTMIGFYLVARGHFDRLCLCFLGFAVGRLIITRFTKTAKNPSCWTQEVKHAPES